MGPWIVVASRKDFEQTPQTAQFESFLFAHPVLFVL